MINPANILLVDDTLENLQVLGDMLRKHGYKVRPAPSGKIALQACAAQPPDLILLDINMPEMNGYEVCARLKADPALAEIPVLFISALSEAMDKVKAFGAGGVDYITKPFQIEEVEARVATHLALRRQRRELADNIDRIRQLESARQALIRLVVHDLRNPLNAIRAFVEEVDERNPALDPDSQKYLRRAHAATNQLIDMVSSLLDLSRMEAGELKLQPESLDLAELCRDIVALVTAQAGSRTLRVETDGPPPRIEADRSLIRRVIQNIVGNALKFTDPERGEIVLRATLEGAQAIVTIRDNGPGIPPEFHQKIFEPFFQVQGTQTPGVHSTGLGLSFCKLAVERHGGRIAVSGGPGQGSTFRITLPPRPPVA